MVVGLEFGSRFADQLPGQFIPEQKMLRADVTMRLGFF
jgi:hypothetical protein